jgi:CheY-like chemotaxis protein
MLCPTSPRLLVVEDHPETLRCIATLLRRESDPVATASSFHKALEVAAENPVDVLLCDIGLPDGSGSDLMRSLSEKYNVRASQSADTAS